MKSPIIVALDFNSESTATAFLDNIDPSNCRVKIGKELFTAAGPSFVRTVVNKGFDVFLDLKFHDIPNTVSKATQVAADLGVWMVNVHAAGGRVMLEETRKGLESFGEDKPLLIAVTVLTSMARNDLSEIGLDCDPLDQVKRLARLSKDSGIDGVVCSAAETKALRQDLGSEFALVTPGIRRQSDATGDQKRVTGPAEAMVNGSDYLVIGRPITQAEQPNEALSEFNLAVAGVK